MNKTCVACRWVRGSGEFAECAAPQNFEVRKDFFATKQPTYDLVGMGGVEKQAKSHVRWYYCTTQRSGGAFDAWAINICGPQGRWWEPR